MPNSTSDIREAVRARALAEGFDAVRFAPAAATREAAQRLGAFLAAGRHGTMDWLEKTAARRADPIALWPETKSVVVVGANYGPDHDPLNDLQDGAAGTISVYARGNDYHDVLKKRLKRLARFMVERFGGDAKVFVDTAPVLEKPLAQEAGLGWQGKHTNLVSREFGSWLFLGSVFTTMEIEADPPERDRCGACHACLDICPTRAFPAPYQLDARRCISYLTIEYKGHIPRAFREAIGNRVYGCDDCLTVCPWNKFAQVSHEFQARETLKRPRLAELARLDDAAFRALFRGSPIKRIGRDRFVRNVLVAIGNSGEASLAAEAERLLDDPSPLVRAMAVWALSRLTDTPRFGALLSARAAQEANVQVREEWLSPRP
ncbi:MAG: tRNA epoxyqueuosine(34) reductase QueG [Alphaproteobacteria bacterium]|nr:tRNA epoxyqueuosine(34) reductase QueG [Alphaproteobacteria bacterium]MDE2629850.1 tRNA epoxyqueuosine(34) reductase QueG [Alphaproteobacteria bacterium]